MTYTLAAQCTGIEMFDGNTRFFSTRLRNASDRQNEQLSFKVTLTRHLPCSLEQVEARIHTTAIVLTESAGYISLYLRVRRSPSAAVKHVTLLEKQENK